MSRFDGWTQMKKQVNARGIDFDVFVDDFGKFIGRIDKDDWVEAPSLRELTISLEKVVQDRSKKIAIPFCFLQVRGKVKKGLVRGVHAAHKRALVTWESGEKEAVPLVGNDFWELPAPEQEKRLNEIDAQIEILFAESRRIIAAIPKFGGKEMMAKITTALGKS